MKPKLHQPFIALALLALSILNSKLSVADAQGTAFTYSGRMTLAGDPANGLYDFKFALFNAANGGAQIGSTIDQTAIGVTNGLLNATLDFGPVFTGNATWLEIAVRTNGGTAYTDLDPLQPLTPAPYAIFANTASNVSGTLPAAQVSGSLANGQLTFSSVTVTAGTGLSGGGAVALGGSTTLKNAGVLTVTGNGDILATTTSGGVTLSSTATSANSSNAIVKRDASGNFSAATITANLVGAATLAHNLASGVNITNANITNSTFAGNGGGLTNLNASQLTGGALPASALAAVWQLTGNAGTTPGQNFLGTTDDQPLELWVNDSRAFRLEPSPNGAKTPNVIGGSSANSVANGVSGATIAGGGEAPARFGLSFPNSVTADFGTVGGGFFNSAQGSYSTVAGGNSNSAGSTNATVSGGNGNSASGENFGGATVGGGVNNSATGDYAVVGGGFYNQATNDDSAVLGGYTNTAGGVCAVVVGGSNNTVTVGADFSFIGGGRLNYIDVGDSNSVIAGGDIDYVASPISTVSGGFQNVIFTDCTGSAIGGGIYNSIESLSSTALFATIAGGASNTVDSDYGVVGGGANNSIFGRFATIPGGYENLAEGEASFAAGLNTEANGAESFALGMNTVANEHNTFVWGDGTREADSQGTNSFAVLATGGVWFYTGAGSAGIMLAPGSSSWATISDRNAKKNIVPVDYKAVLNKLATVPIEQWNYNWEKDTDVPNIGPMAQDFKSAFYPGRSDKSITTLEFDGVELAAIQALNQKLNDKDAKIDSLEKQNLSLAARLDELEATVRNLAARP